MNQNSFLTIGIGASAGGLAVLKRFIKSLPAEAEMAFIIVQHLDPTHESMLSELLNKESLIPIKDAEDGIQVKAGNVYVIPPNTYLTIQKGRLKLSEPKHKRGHRKAIDHFFESLAEECGQKAAAIILSGAGNDGTSGLKYIKAEGGLTLIQNPDSAEHSSMPRSAIESGLADKILDVEEMYEVLESYAENSENIPEGNDFPVDQMLGKVESLLTQRAEFNLEQYKTGTVKRRILRRMSLASITNFSEYLEQLENDPEERQALVKDLMINVTSFFRDQEGFEFLKSEILPEIIDSLSEDNTIRVWVPGCASGEEAYSLAISLLEIREEQKETYDITIFATDIDEEAIQFARKGLYAKSLTGNIPEDYLKKYFTAEGNDYYRIRSHVRNLISFATHHIANDPPFSQLHLVSCRNLLIYLRKGIQEKVLSSFYFSLKPEGILFLGNSETVGTSSQLFKTISKKWRIFQKIEGNKQKEIFLDRLHMKNKINSRSHKILSGTKKSSPSSSNSILEAISEAFLPPTIVIDWQGNIIYTQGNIKPYIFFPSGEPKNNLFQMSDPSLSSRLRSSVFKVRKSDEPVSFLSTLEQDGKKISAKITVSRIDAEEYDEELIGVMFSNQKDSHEPDSATLTEEDVSNANKSLETELAETKEELQNTIEELETTTEELKSSHEEALSTNEELQSANEELEASSEELRSLNEELSTVNAQLKKKIEQLQQANDDLENFIDSTDIATIFLDKEMRVQRYTPAAEQLLKMGPQDVGRPIGDLGRDLVDEQLQEDGSSVLRNFRPIQREKKTYDGRWFIRQVSPYRTQDLKVEGVVVVFQEVTEIKSLSNRAKLREQQQAAVASLGMMALTGASPEKIMNHAVQSLAHTLGVDYAKVLKYEPEKHHLKLIAGVGWQPGLVGSATVPNDRESQAGYTLLSPEPVLTENVEEEKRFSAPELLVDHQVVSGMSCKIGQTEPPYGVLGVHSKDPRKFTKDDANFVQSVANLIYTAIQNKKYQSDLERSEERLSMAREAGKIGIHDYDIRNNTIKWDETIRNIWGVNQDLNPITYEVFAEGLHPDDRERVNETLSLALSEKGNGEFLSEYRVVNKKDKEVRWVEASGKAIFREGQAVRLVGTVQDITDRKELEISLQDAIEDLKKEDERKNEFLAVLGHELRNPLGAISMILNILEKKGHDLDNMVPMMRNNVNVMSKLLDELLDITRVAQNRIVLEKESVVVNQILKDLLFTTQEMFEVKNQTVEADIEEGLYTWGDPMRIQQILNNLLKNASKYTPMEGKIEVSAKKEQDEIVVLVKDEGIGISQDELENIFRPFYQANKNVESDSGLGLGLALSKNLIELHNGKLMAHSEGKGKGSEFETRLPFSTEGKQEKEESSNGGSPSVENTVNKKIVVIDDNKDILSSLEIILSDEGFDVHTAGNGKEGIQLVREHNPAVAIIDIGLPDLSGHEVAEKILSTNLSPSPTLIAFSGYSHKEARDKSEEVGFDHHLAKPLDLDEFMDLLNEINNQNS